MIEIILNSIVSYISTNMDYLLVLILLIHAYKSKLSILIGDLIGTTILTTIPIIIAIWLRAIPQTWMIGFLGIFPLYFAFSSLLGNQNHILNESNKHKSRIKLVIHTVIITVTACGADNIAIYIPIFIQKTNFELSIALVVMLCMAIVFFMMALMISKNHYLENFLNRYARYLTFVIYLYLGCSVITQCGTLAHFFK